MRALQRVRDLPAPAHVSFHSLLAQFSSATLELNPSLGITEFARRLTVRTSEIFRTRAAVLVLGRETAWEVAAISGPAHRWNRTVQNRLAAALIEEVNSPHSEWGIAEPAEAILGLDLAHALAWHRLSAIPLKGSEGTLLGVLCLVDPVQVHSKIERQLLAALASHASVA